MRNIASINSPAVNLPSLSMSDNFQTLEIKFDNEPFKMFNSNFNYLANVVAAIFDSSMIDLATSPLRVSSP